MKPRQRGGPLDNAFARAAAPVRGEWLLRQLEPAYAHSAGQSAVVGRGRFDELDSAWLRMSNADRLTWLVNLNRRALDIPVAGDFIASRIAGDSISHFLKQCVRDAPGCRVRTAELYQTYTVWAEANGEQRVSSRRFDAQLHRRGLFRLKNSHWYWADIEIPPERAPAENAAECGSPAGDDGAIA